MEEEWILLSGLGLGRALPLHTNTGPAAIWHDGSVNPDSKTVLINCSFEGFDGFNQAVITGTHNSF